MLLITLLAGGYLLLFIGVGLLFPWNLFRSSPSFFHLTSSFWVGLALAIAFLQVWQIFLPVGWPSLLVLAGAGLGGWLWSSKQLRTWLRSLNHILAAVCLVSAAFLIIFLSNLVIFSTPSPDHGLYHLQTVMWFISYGLPPGLANLHYRLAFNNAGFLLAAQVESGIFPGLSYYVTQPLLFGALLLHTAGGFLGILRQPHEMRRTHLAAAFLFFVALKYAGETQLAGYTPDRMIFVIEAVLALAILDLFEKTYPREASFPYRIVYAVLLIGLGVVLKLSFAVFGLAAILAVIGIWMFRKGWAAGVNLRLAATVLTLLAVLVIPWMVRGAIMSGYPLFPSVLLSLPVLWRMPAADVALISSITTNWARTCSNTMPLENGKLWLLTWKNCMPPEFWELLDLSTLVLGAAVLLGLWRNRSKGQKPQFTSALVLLLICLASLLFWLWVLPDYRFAGAAFWLLLLAGLLLLAEQISGLFSPATNLSILAVAALIFIAWLSPNTHHFDIQKRTFFYPPSAVAAAESHYPHGKIISHPLQGGGTVYSPTDPGDACWDAPLPCTQYNDIRPRLTMFNSSNLQSGFYLAPKKP